MAAVPDIFSEIFLTISFPPGVKQVILYIIVTPWIWESFFGGEICQPVTH